MDELKLNSDVVIAISGECGVITGVANYTEEATQYRVHYKDAHGAARTDWFTRSQLTAA